MDATKGHRDIHQVRQAKLDVKNEVAKQLIEAMESGNTPWQRPWKSQSLMPINGATQSGYRGVNRILLALQNRSSNIWLTFNQANDAGYKVRKGEKGTPIVKVVELDRGERNGRERGEDASSSVDGQGDGKEARKAFILRRYFVFNAEQIEGFPIPVEEPGLLAHESVEQVSNVVEAMKEQTGLMVIHGGNNACYVPSLHEVRLPPKRAFDGLYDYWVTALHECAHASMNERCMNRTEAISKRWGDEAYAMEELRAEIASCLLAHTTGLARGQGASSGGPADPYAHHREQHAAYLRSWVKVIKNDPMAILSAAKDADRICEYILGLAMKREAMAPHREWVAAYER
ncbi:zincin-like metallopeptidase domain-containing protein [Paucibacter sp. R3-3]|uniref:Zincin-like metallopeptidase domain-containing protein n=1 Tax=Roseateles agri TaxID=3098619 RepID=A0ABU5DQP0_9BURK|nr:zincin-like metallopeptidase domain-containing protein [Paucibacter sp. R3-3]MDY0747945.1 zincin-like metallopeptidase domain-containing protein [Paucibacter sp. R3-3]